MNYQPLIDNAHLILPSLVVALYLLPRIFEGIGRLIPGDDFFERNAPKLQAAAEAFAHARNLYSQAEEKLGLPKLPGEEKAKEVEALMIRAEGMLKNKQYGALAALIAGYKAGALDKAAKAGLQLPFASAPSPTTPTRQEAPPSESPDNPDRPIGPDDPAQ